MLTLHNLSELSDKIAFVTINPDGSFYHSVRAGFIEVGLSPRHLIYVRPTDRLQREFKKYRLSFFTHFLLPKIKEIYGAGQKIYPPRTAISQLAITVYQTPALNSSKTADIIQKLGVKYLVNCGAGIFRKKIISIPGLIILNAHAGKLPEYKNMNVLEWTVYNGDQVTGTVHQIDSGIDTGPVWLEEEIEIPFPVSLQQAREYTFNRVARMFGRAVILNEKGEIQPRNYSPGQGRNWYVMHSYFRRRVENILQQRIQKIEFGNKSLEQPPE